MYNKFKASVLIKHWVRSFVIFQFVTSVSWYRDIKVRKVSQLNLYVWETKCKSYILTLSRRRPLSYRNQSIDLLRKSMDWFLYNNSLRLERVKLKNSLRITCYLLFWMRRPQATEMPICTHFFFPSGICKGYLRRWDWL